MFSLRLSLCCAAIAAPIATSLVAGPFEIGPVEDLPRFEVTADAIVPKPEHWSYEAYRGVEVLTNVKAPITDSLVDDFVDYREVVDQIWPIERMGDPLPSALILCRGPISFQAFITPSGAGKGNSFWERGSSGEEQNLTTAFVGGDEGFFVMQLNPEDDANPGTFGGVVRDALERNFARNVQDRLWGNPPRWLYSGLTKILENLVYGNGKFLLPGFTADPTLRTRILPGHPGFDRALAAKTFFPLGELLTARQQLSASASDTLEIWGGARASGLNDFDVGPWDNECYEFAAYCLLGAQFKYREAFLHYVHEASSGPVDEAVFKRCFGVGYDEMTRQVWDDASLIQNLQFTPKKPSPNGVALLVARRDATDAEVFRLRGEVLLREGDLMPAHWALLAPYLRGSRDPELLSVLGLQEAIAHRPDRANKFLSLAIQEGTRRARAYTVLAKILCNGVQSDPAAKLDPAIAKRVVDLMAKGESLPPVIRDDYILLTVALEHGGLRPTRDQLTILDRGADRFPYDGLLAYHDARAHLSAGFPKEAVDLCNAALVRFPEGNEFHDRLARLQANATSKLPKTAEK